MWCSSPTSTLEIYSKQPHHERVSLKPCTRIWAPGLTCFSYEGDWDREWEPVKSTVTAFVPTASIPPEPTRNYIAPKGKQHLEAQRAAQQKPRRVRKSSSIALPESYRPTLQVLKPGGSTSFANGNLEAHFGDFKHVQRRVLELEAYKKYIDKKDQPDYRVEMMHTFKEVAKVLPKHHVLSSLQVAEDEIAKICISTDAFIALPAPDSYIMEIWGTPQQVDNAKTSLKAWEMHYRGPGKHTSKTSNNPWLKQNAFDGREEHRLMRENLVNHQQQIFQQLANGTILPFEAHLIWPEGYDLDNFIADYDEHALNNLRSKYECLITHSQNGLRETKVSCASPTSLFQVYNRLLGLMKEMVARKKRGLRVTYCRLPSAQEYRDQVKLNPTIVRARKAHIPERLGNPLPSSEDPEHWPRLTTMRHRKYQTATKRALQSSIESLYVSQKHVRMRVSFGRIALTKFKQPANGQDAPYDHDEFVTMVQNPQVEIVQLPLATGAHFDFIDRVEAIKDFGDPEYFWAIHFDFTGTMPGSTLRFEIEYTPNDIDVQEPNISAKRWLHFSSDTTQDVNELLEISHMEVGKVGYQFHIGAARLFENSKIKRELSSFENNVTFKPSLNAIRSPPGKHAIFPQGNGDLTAVTEITIARYRFKDTKGVFEIKRIDHFSQRPGETSSVPQLIEWHAAYYYQEWDTLTAQLANIVPGQDVNWKRDLTTFFPKVIDKDSPKALPEGFKNFMKEVEKIQELLDEVVDRNSDNA